MFVDASMFTGSARGTVSVGTRQRQDAERILGGLLTPNRLSIISPDGFAASFRSASAGPIRVIQHHYRNFAGSESTGPLDMFAMSLPLYGDLVAEMDGGEVVVPRGFPLVANPGATPRMRGSAATGLLTLKIPAELVLSALATQVPRLGRTPALRFRPMASRRAAGALAQAMWTVHETVREGGAPSMRQQKTLSNMLVSSLLLSHPHNLTRELYLAGRSATDSAVWEAVAILRDAPASRVTIAELARESGVSVRSLQLGFVRLVGVTPSEFQRELRLTLAHELIAGNNPGHCRTVAEVAAQAGYVHQGRFAADYRRRFGRTPSAALRERH